MPRASMIPTLLREVLGKPDFPREPEPDLVMDDQAQVAAYSEAGRIDGVMSAAYLFHTARISMAINGCARVYDLGCGPATQLAQVAQLNPDTQFVGVDLSEEMISSGKSYCASLGLDNVSFVQADITDLPMIDTDSADGVTSTMALHHLPTRGHLDRCFAEIRRVLRPGGALYLTDFTRLKSLRSVLFFAYMNREHQPHLFSLDYERSLRAAFHRSDFEELVGDMFPEGVNLHVTSGIPILGLIKSADHQLGDTTLRALKALQNALPSRYKADLNDIRLLFKMGGLKNDPF